MNAAIFSDRHQNDETGCPAYDPKILLKVEVAEPSQSRRRDTTALQASRWVCAGDARMLECRRWSGIDAFWSQPVRRPRLAGFHGAIRPAHRREMAFENPLKEAYRMNSPTSPPSPSLDEAAVHALLQQMKDAWNTGGARPTPLRSPRMVISLGSMGRTSEGATRSPRFTSDSLTPTSGGPDSSVRSRVSGS
jgi:hypothetical protein